MRSLQRGHLGLCQLRGGNAGCTIKLHSMQAHSLLPSATRVQIISLPLHLPQTAIVVKLVMSL